MFYLYMSKNVVIVLATYMHISYLDTLKFLLITCVLFESKKLALMELKRLSKFKFCSIIIGARVVLTHVFKVIVADYLTKTMGDLRKWGYSPLLW